MNAFRLALAALLLLALPPLAAQTAVDRSAPVDADARVEIENLAGSVSVRGWDGTDVRITGTLGRGVEELRVEGDRRRLAIQVVYPRNGRFRSADATELTIDVPRGVELSVQTVSADVLVEDVSGTRVDLRSVSGGIDASSDASELAIGTVSGAVTIRGGRERVKVETVSGRAEVETGASSIDVRSVSGRVGVAAGSVERLQAATVSGSVDLQIGGLASGGRIESETMSGSVSLSVPAGLSAAIEASTFSGNIRSDFGEVVAERYGPGKSLNTETGGASGRIKATAFSGTVTIRRR